MFLRSPSYVRHGRQFIKDARKLVAFKRDLVSGETVEAVQREIAHLEHALESRERTTIETQMKRLDEICGKLSKPSDEAGIRENVEVIIVAIVIALAVRTYFLQPFAIPTGSMQPTLNGIIATKTDAPPPNFMVQALHKALFFRTWFDVVARADESLSSAEEVTKNLFTYTKLETSAGNTYLIHGGREPLLKAFNLAAGTTFKKGEPIARGYIDTGDHVFVDKISYHFLRPKRDQVFVFSTRDIPRLNSGGQPSQFYIKRLAGVPNDSLRIDPPTLYINGAVPQQSGFQRVMSGRLDQPVKGYQGYGNARMDWGSLLMNPHDEFTVPPDCYFALGDNSYNSFDSRGWGPVPRVNVTGRALLVYYPFTRHLGWIR